MAQGKHSNMQWFIVSSPIPKERNGVQQGNTRPKQDRTSSSTSDIWGLGGNHLGSKGLAYAHFSSSLACITGTSLEVAQLHASSFPWKMPYGSGTSNIVGSSLKLRLRLYSFKHGFTGPSRRDSVIVTQLST